MRLVGTIAALGLYLLVAGCFRPSSSYSPEGPVETSQPAILTQGAGLQTSSSRSYNNGDPWPFRITSAGLAAMVLTLGYTIRHLGMSRPDNGDK